MIRGSYLSNISNNVEKETSPYAFVSGSAWSSHEKYIFAQSVKCGIMPTYEDGSLSAIESIEDLSL